MVELRFHHRTVLTQVPWQKSNNNPGGKDPWGGSNQGPPDLDDLFRKMTSGIGRIFSKRGGGSGSGGDRISVSAAVVVILVLTIWLLSGIYIIDEGKRGVILRFGAYQTTTEPGPHWHLPVPVEAVEKVDIDSIRSVQNEAQMLTKDENIVEVELAVQYRVKNAADYLFNVRKPDTETFENPAEGTVFQVMESALREVVGKSKMDFTLGAGRAEIASQTKDLMQSTLDDYMSGLEIISVNLQQSQPPPAVQDAFADAIKAREDEIRFFNEAQAYANGILPKARGEAARMNEEAIAYREKVIANAEGEAERFLKLYEEYRKAPEVTRERLYLQAMEKVLSDTSKVMMDIEGGNSIFYLPLDKMINRDSMKSNERRNDGSGSGVMNRGGSTMPDSRSRSTNRGTRGGSGRN